MSGCWKIMVHNFREMPCSSERVLRQTSQVLSLSMVDVKSKKARRQKAEGPRREKPGRKRKNEKR